MILMHGERATFQNMAIKVTKRSLIFTSRCAKDRDSHLKNPKQNTICMELLGYIEKNWNDGIKKFCCGLLKMAKVYSIRAVQVKERDAKIRIKILLDLNGLLSGGFCCYQMKMDRGVLEPARFGSRRSSVS